MYTMPRLFPLSKNRKWPTPVAVFALLTLVFFAVTPASAQRRRQPTRTPQQQGAANANTQTAQAKPQKKNITPLRSGDTSEGSRITITSDAPLNDYSAYRSGDRYYVVIPEANAPRAQSGLRGRGFEDVQVQRRGNDAILSFKLQPGTNARVSQRFNRLDVELTAPGGRAASVPTPTPKAAATPATAQPTPQTTPRSTPQTATAGQPSTGAGTQPTTPQTGSATNPVLTPQGTGANPAVVYAPTPDASASPGASPAASPVATPPAEQIAQAQPPTTTQPATTTTTSTTSTTGTSLGTMLRQNWLVILIAALVLLSLVMIVVARSRAQRTAGAAAPARRVSRKERQAAKKATAELEEADKAVPVADVLYKSSTLPKAKPLATATTADAVDEAEAVEDEAMAAPVLAGEEAAEAELAPAVDVERIENEVRNVLGGESYDEEIIGATDAGTRQFVATGLLAALAARNVEQRERARQAFVKHDYLNEATRQLRTADAPAERASAARTLGYVQDKSTTPHLVAALDDDSPDVRRAAVESLAELHDPSAIQPLEDLLKRERDRKVSRSLIKRAIEASAVVVEEEQPTLEAATAPVTETAPLEEPSVAGQADAASLTETETPTLEAETPTVETEQPSAALADVSSVEAAPELVALAASPVVEEVDTEAEEAARKEAEEEAARQRAAEEERQRAEEEERLRVEAEAARQAEEEARKLAEAQAEEERRQAEEEAARLRAEEEERERAAEEERQRLEAEARQRAEEEARQRAEEEAARLKAEEERQRAEEAARLAAEAEAQRQAAEEARLKAEEEARFKAEEEARLAAEAEAQRLAEEEAARKKAEAEARQRAEEEAAARRHAEAEAERRAEQERLRLEEEARVRAEAAAEAARVGAEEEAARLRAEEEARLLAEEDARRLAAEEAAATLSAEAISPVEHEAADEFVTSEPATLLQPAEPFIERNEGTASDWVDVDVSDVGLLRQEDSIATPPAEEIATQEAASVEPALEPIQAESKEIEPSRFEIIEQPASQPASKEIEYAVSEKGLAEFDEFSSVPGVILKRLSSEEPNERASAVADLARVGGDDSFREINAAFDDPAVEVRNAAARSLFNLNADRAATFTRALRESPPERRRKIGAALASSGLASEAISQLMGESREKTYDAFSLLFLMSKAGEVQPLMRAIEEHPNNEVRLAVVKLLALSGQQEILPAFRRLAVRGSLPTEVRSAVMEAIYQISSQSPTAA
jgi:HEAT repeats